MVISSVREYMTTTSTFSCTRQTIFVGCRTFFSTICIPSSNDLWSFHWSTSRSALIPQLIVTCCVGVGIFLCSFIYILSLHSGLWIRLKVDCVILSIGSWMWRALYRIVEGFTAFSSEWIVIKYQKTADELSLSPSAITNKRADRKSLQPLKNKKLDSINWWRLSISASSLWLRVVTWQLTNRPERWVKEKNQERKKIVVLDIDWWIENCSTRQRDAFGSYNYYYFWCPASIRYSFQH